MVSVQTSKNATIFRGKLPFQNVQFSPQEHEKPTLSYLSSLKSVFKKLRFLDGLAWTVGVTVEIKLLFQIPPE